MADIAPQSWSQLIQKLQEQGESQTISRLYAYSAEENGNQFEGLEGAISSALIALGYDTSAASDLYQDAPFMVSERNTFEDFEQEKEKHNTDHGYGGGGSLNNHEKYESDILGKLGQQHQQEALDELTSIRGGTGFSDEQKKELEEIQNNTTLSDEAKKQLLDTYKQEALEQKFREILQRNATAEDTIQEQHELLARQLDASQKDIPLKPGELSPAEHIRRRAVELRNERSEERIEFSNMDISDINEKLAKKQKLSALDKSRLERYRYLQTRNAWEKRSSLSQKDIEGWVKRFGTCKTQEEQDLLLRKLLARQQRRTQNEMWKVFNKKTEKMRGFKRIFLTSDQGKKTLTRKQKRSLLAYQKAHLLAFPQKGFLRRIPLRPFFSPFSQPEYSYSPPAYQDNDDSGGGPSLLDRAQQAKDLFDKAKDLAKLGKFFSGGGGAAGGAGLAAAAPWIIIGVVVLLVILVIIVILSNKNNQDVNPDLYATAIPCGEQVNPQHELKGIMQERFFVTVTDYSGPPNAGAGPEGDNPRGKDSVIFNTFCWLYGRTPDKYNGSNNYMSSFGKLFLGAEKVKSLDKNNNNLQLVNAVSASDNITPCSVNDFASSLRSSKGVLDLKIYQPDWAPPPSTDLASQALKPCTDAQLMFQTARAAAITLYERETNHYYGHFTQDITPDFDKLEQTLTNWSTTFASLSNQGVFLPTARCQATKSAEDCFADMVGEYLTYPTYIDSSNQLGITSSFIAFACSDTKTNPYYPYYQWAKENLFNGSTFYTLTGDPCGGNNASGNDIADYAQNLVSNFKKTQSCYHLDQNGGGWAYIIYHYIVTRNRISDVLENDTGCIDTLQPTLTAPVSDMLHKSILGDIINGNEHLDTLQCVGFVRAAVLGVGKGFSHSEDLAKEFITDPIPPDGYRFFPKSMNASMQPGDIPVWDRDVAGHIAIATKIYGSKDKTYAFDAAEGNGVFPGSVDKHQYSFDDPSFKGWLRWVGLNRGR